jgi:hypothetical protein
VLVELNIRISLIQTGCLYISQYNLRAIFKEKGKEAKVIIAISDNISRGTARENECSVITYGKLAKNSIYTTAITCPELLRAIKM